MDMVRPLSLPPKGPPNGLVAKTQIAGTTSTCLMSSHTLINHKHSSLPYWQKRLNCDGLVTEVQYPPYTHHLYFLKHGQDIVFHTLTSKDNTIGGPKSVPCDETKSKGNLQNTLANSPAINSREAKVRAVRSRRSQAISSTLVIPRSPAARDRQAINKTKHNEDTLRAARKPLSQIAVETPYVFVPDAKTFAHRPVEDRRREAASTGKIKRPLNAFMLYRRSYQNVAKTRCMRNNHQQISTVCGYSWKAHEPPDIVEKFNQLACIEKEMHRQAFPDYKYDPFVSKKIGEGVGLLVPSDRGNIDDSSDSRPVAHGLWRHGANDSNFTHRPQLCEDKSLARGEATDTHHGLPSTVPISLNFTTLSSRRFAMPSEPSNLMRIDNFAHRDQYHGASIGDSWTFGGIALSVAAHKGGVMDPRLYFYDPLYIDTALLTTQHDLGHNEGILPRLPVLINHEGGCNQHAKIKPNPEYVLPALGIMGDYSSYVKGTDEDWEVELLGKGNHFQDWFSQIEADD